MTAILVTKARRSRYISKEVFENRADARGTAPTWVAAPGYEDLVRAFINNKAYAEFVTAYFDDVDRGRGSDYEDIDHWIMDIKDFCDRNCTGLWTYHQNYRRNSDFNSKTHHYSYLDTGTGRLSVHFENEADIEMFLTKCPIFQNDKS